MINFKMDYKNEQVILKDNRLNFKIYIRSKKNIILKVSDYNFLTISVPKRTPKKIIEEFIFNNMDKIIEVNNGLYKDYKNFYNEIYILGEKNKVVFNKTDSGKVKFLKKDGTLEINCSRDEDIFHLLYEYYFQLTSRLIEEKVNYYRKVMKVNVNNIYVKDVKTIWGSCSGKNNITFNFRLSMCDEDIIDYVVVHELAHLIHRNHSQDFWDFVAKFIPNWKELRKSLNSDKYKNKI